MLLTSRYNIHLTRFDLAQKKLDAAYSWPPDLTDEQILEKPLALNLERAGKAV